MNNKKIASAIAVVLCLMMLASLVLSVIPVSAYADELDDLKSQKASLSSQMQAKCEKIYYSVLIAAQLRSIIIKS